MQLTPRYLVNNRVNIIANDAGFVTEYKPVYQRQLQVYRGIDNVLEFKLLNADQKPIDLQGRTAKFQAFDENHNLIIEHNGVALMGDDSASSRGLFSVTITDNDLLNIKQQYLSYNVHLENADGSKTLTFTDSHFGAAGVIYVNSDAFPGPRDTYSITTFTEVTEDTPYWASETLNAEPGINGNEALHTAVIYTDGYAGTVTVQATLDNSVTESSAWADVTVVTFSGDETEPTPVNFNGVYSHLRFVASLNPANKITKILVRN